MTTGWLSGQPDPLTEALTQGLNLARRHRTSGVDSPQGWNVIVQLYVRPIKHLLCCMSLNSADCGDPQGNPDKYHQFTALKYKICLIKLLKIIHVCKKTYSDGEN